MSVFTVNIHKKDSEKYKVGIGRSKSGVDWMDITIGSSELTIFAPLPQLQMLGLLIEEAVTKARMAEIEDDDA